MAKIKFTKKFIDSLEYSDKTVIYQDEVVNGFAVRTNKTSKSYLVNKRIDGKLQRKVFSDCSHITLQDARDRSMSIISDLMQGIDPFDKPAPEFTAPTLREAYAYYLASKPDLKGSSIKSYNRQINRNLECWLDISMNDIMQGDITDKHLELSKHSLSQSNGTFKALRAVWNFSRLSFLDKNEMPIIKPNPVEMLTAKKAWNTVKPRTRHLNEDVMGHYVKVLVDFKSEDFHNMMPHSNNARDIMLLFLFTGIRANEGYTLRWDSIDLKHGTITILDTKNSDTLSVPLGKVMVAMLNNRHKYKQDEPWLFPSRVKDCDSNLTGISKQYTNIGKLAGIHITPHDLRRTFSTVADALNFNMSVIKRLINHRESRSSDDVTLQYIQVSQKRLRAAMNDIEVFIFNEAGMTQDEVIERIYHIY
ncbi:tyrosine-type recombinase/integrase [Psychrobacter faecalis]|uniref:tyrosine-type recombinase/integrase n=1 Tax=Psychrobacter TaxID=497 RepID=UPI0019187CC6|nr:tyrosine-type recombinase/integrase [Psychrobacter immobilis]